MIELIAHEPSEARLFFSLVDEAAERHGAVCFTEVWYKRSGGKYVSRQVDNQRSLDTPVFKKDLNRVFDYLCGHMKTPPLRSRQDFAEFCREHEGQIIAGDGLSVPTAFGIKLQSEGYTHYIRFYPSGDRCVIHSYDNRYLLPELAGQHELPPRCVSILRSTLHDNCCKLVILKRGETGYFDHQLRADTPEQARQKADELNCLMGVTRAQEKAMYAGSIFGFTVPAAKPWNYDMDGKPRVPERKEPDRKRDDGAR